MESLQCILDISRYHFSNNSEKTPVRSRCGAFFLVNCRDKCLVFFLWCYVQYRVIFDHDISRVLSTVEPLWRGQESLIKVLKFGTFSRTILYKSCLFYASWQATSFERPPSWAPQYFIHDRLRLRLRHSLFNINRYKYHIRFTCDWQKYK